MNEDTGCSRVEQGPIRPPSEARSLLIRVTRNCPWNRCAFCRTYQGEKFSLRPVAEINEEIRRLADAADQIRGRSLKTGEARRSSEASPEEPFYRFGDPVFQYVMTWLARGGKSVFLQDADSLTMKTADLAEVLSSIRKAFPSVERITTYARAKSAAKKTAEELTRLREAGLSRIHVGMESGYDPLLKFIRKGVTSAEQIEAGQKIREAGISLCQYVIPGLGGSRWSREHATATAEALSRINPDHIRLRTLQVVPGTFLEEKVREGEFQPLGDEAILREIRLLLETLTGIDSEVVSDHILNLLEELEGKLPRDREKLLGIIDRYFALPQEERVIFRLGRRTGDYRGLDDLTDRATYQRLRTVVERYSKNDPVQLERDLSKIMQRYI